MPWIDWQNCHTKSSGDHRSIHRKRKMIELITDPLRRGGKEFEVFSDVVPDAPVGKIAEGVKKFLEYQPEVVVAVGGGSAIDSSRQSVSLP